MEAWRRRGRAAEVQRQVGDVGEAAAGAGGVQGAAAARRRRRRRRRRRVGHAFGLDRLERRRRGRRRRAERRQRALAEEEPLHLLLVAVLALRRPTWFQ